MNIFKLKDYAASQPKQKLVDLAELIKNGNIKLGPLSSINDWSSDLNYISLDKAYKLIKQDIEGNLVELDISSAQISLYNLKEIKAATDEAELPIFKENSLPKPINYGKLTKDLITAINYLKKTHQENADVAVFR